MSWKRDFDLRAPVEFDILAARLNTAMFPCSDPSDAEHTELGQQPAAEPWNLG